ncbi:MAG: protein kinase domain-containing protein [Bdellovibrionota bacterium]
MSSDSDSEERSEKKFGRYEIIEQLATGGMARIYKASTSANRVYSLKKILPDFSKNEEFIHMFLQEAKISLNLKHPNVIRVYDFGQVDESYYLAMEYVFGQNLGAILKKSVSTKIHIPIPIASYLILECCRGLDYAHSLTDSFGNNIGVIHRDISPPNILVSYNGEPKILDFGIAKAVSVAQARVTRSGVLKGKFSYMSPEQARGEDLNPQSDVFSLGIVFWELLTSQSLFYSKDELETLERVRKANVKAPSKIRKSVPRELDKIVLKALDPKLKKRFSSCREFAEAISQFMDKNYPHTDHRDVAKFVRLLFATEFQEKRGQAIRESWKDVFVSGGSDDEIMLDRSSNFTNTTQTKKRDHAQPSFLARLIYDPKWGSITRKVTETSLVLFALGIFSFYFLKSDFYQNLKSEWLSTSEASAPPAKISAPSTPPTTLEVRGFQWWLDRASELETRGNLDEALAAYERALEINAYDQTALVKKHFLRIRKDGDSQSCQWFRNQADLSRADKSFAAALCFEARNQKIKALEAYDEFIREFPKDLRTSEANEKFISLSENLD